MTLSNLVIKRKNVFIFLLTAAAICFIFSACQSLQKDLQVSSADEKTHEELAGIEEAVVRLDGKAANREELIGARQKITTLEKSVVDTDFQGKLAAWSGRLYLMEGRTADAQRELRKSQNLSPRNIPSQVLLFRMERDGEKRLALIDEAIGTDRSLGELLIERGRALFDLARFQECVAAFDSAFITLREKAFYEEAYRMFRDKAWELKDLGQGTENRTREIAGQNQITWRDLIEITRTETDLFRFITAGREWPAETLFIHLLDRAFIPYIQDTAKTEWPSAKPPSSEIVLRSGAAWFIWHLYAENRANRGLLTRYSSRYGNTPNARSPIADLGLSSPFIDSVLGCVESEFMSLPDGRNFMPHERVRGSEYLSILRKLQP